MGNDALERDRPTPAASLYGQLLAYARGHITDPAERARVDELVRTNPRWRAHWESLRDLDLERAAARVDARHLKRFDVETSFCQVVAVSAGRVLLDLVRGQRWVGGRSRAEWSRHIKECVYCRRVRRLAHAQVAREAKGLPEGEALLRDWLLERLYREPLARVTERLRQSALVAAPGEGLTDVFRRDPLVFLAKMEPVVPLLLDRVLPPAVTLADHPRAFLDYLRTDAVLTVLRTAPHVRDALGGVLATFCRQRGLCDPQAVQSYLTRNVVDNILWQAAVAQCSATGPEEEEKSGLRTVERALKQQLQAGAPEPAEQTVTRALAGHPQVAEHLRACLDREITELTR